MVINIQQCHQKNPHTVSNTCISDISGCKARREALSIVHPSVSICAACIRADNWHGQLDVLVRLDAWDYRQQEKWKLRKTLEDASASKGLLFLSAGYLAGARYIVRWAAWTERKAMPPTDRNHVLYLVNSRRPCCGCRVNLD